jgi:hypothetical protein
MSVVAGTRHVRKLDTAKSNARSGIESNAVQGAIPRQDEQMAIVGANRAGIQDGIALPLEGP